MLDPAVTEKLRGRVARMHGKRLLHKHQYMTEGTWNGRYRRLHWKGRDMWLTAAGWMGWRVTWLDPPDADLEALAADGGFRAALTGLGCENAVLVGGGPQPSLVAVPASWAPRWCRPA